MNTLSRETEDLIPVTNKAVKGVPAQQLILNVGVFNLSKSMHMKHIKIKV